MRKPIRNIFVTILLFLGLSLSFVGTAQALYSLHTVTWGSWILYSQQSDNWCWAASSKMMIQKAKGTSPSECEIVKRQKNTSSCLDSTATVSEVSAIMNRYNVSSSQHAGVPSFSHIRSNTTNGGGVNVRVAWNSGGSIGHFAPVIGSTSNNMVYITHIRTNGVSASWVNYSQFAAGTAGLGALYTPTDWITSY